MSDSMNLTDDEIANWATGRPSNPTTEQGVRMALELQHLRAAKAADKERVRSVVYGAIREIARHPSGHQVLPEDDISAIADHTAEQLASPATDHPVGYLSNARLAEIGQASRDAVTLASVNAGDLRLLVAELQRRRAGADSQLAGAAPALSDADRGDLNYLSGWISVTLADVTVEPERLQAAVAALDRLLGVR